MCARGPGNTKHKVPDSDLTAILVITAGLRDSQEAGAIQTLKSDSSVESETLAFAQGHWARRWQGWD